MTDDPVITALKALRTQTEQHLRAIEAMIRERHEHLRRRSDSHVIPYADWPR
jgi:hypothetical protein